MDGKIPKSVIGGLACRMPMSKNSQEFWDNLINGKDMMGNTHWPPGLYGLPPRIGALPELDCFDNTYFEIPSEEADNMNPMLRHLLEVTYECIVDSGLALATIQNTKTGIYLACFGSDTDNTETSSSNTKWRSGYLKESTSPYLVGGLAKSFGLTGPTVTVDTACSSSIATFNMAVSDLLSGKCTYAIVTGCNLIINPLFSQQMFVLGMLSKDGISSVFDEAANGYVRAEGCAALLLARDAECFPRVYCNVIDVGVNCDGYKKAGITNPNPEIQASLMKEIYKRSGVNVKDIYYVEAHGTGTQVGDTAETTGIADVFCEDRDEPLLIGSVKSNMGHSEATSALAAMIKVILMMHYKEIPGNINYKNPNPKIHGIHSNKLKVVDKSMPLKGKYVGISSFGFGGVNGHVILEPYQENNKDDFVHVPGHIVVPITARNFESVQNIAEFINNNRYNSVLLGMLSESQLSCDEKQPMRGFIQIGPGEDDFFVHCDTKESCIPSVCLCLEDFMGCYISVHKDLLEIDNFMASLTSCSKIIKRMDPTLEIIPMLKTGEMFMPHTRTGMLIATAILISMHEMLEDALLGYKSIIGCGLTEVAGAYLDGCLTLDQCFNVINCIGKHVEEFSKNNEDKWAIYDVHLDFDLIYQLGPGTQVLCINTPYMATVAIETKNKDKVLKDKIHSAGGFYNLLVSNVPMYSPHLKETSEKIKKDLRDIIPSPVYRSSGLVSAQSGWRCAVEDENKLVLFDADYISKIICKPVNLAAKLVHKPDDYLYLRMLPTTLPPPHLRRAHLDISCTSDNSFMSQNVKTPTSNTRQSFRYRSMSTQSALDDTEQEGSYSLVDEHEDIPFVATAESFCHTIGELHMKDYQLNVGFLFPKPKQPMGINCPSLSPLVTWDHSVNWNIPNWMEFSCRIKDEVTCYEITVDSDEGIHTPVAVLLYHAWQAISEEVEEMNNDPDCSLMAIKMTNLYIPNESLLINDRIDGAIIHVHVLTKEFAVVSEGDVLLQGHFEVSDSILLPSVPGYDLDINDNVQLSPKDSEPVCEKTEIKWEDDWLDFINDILEFSNLCTESSLLEMIIDPKYHLKEAKECPNFLAVAEKYTGVCRSGGLALEHKLSLTSELPEFSLNQITISNPSQTLVSKVMVYNLYSHQSPVDRVILYEAEKRTSCNGSKVVGIMNLNGDKLMDELPVPPDWLPEDIEALIPYVIAAYIVYEVARIRNQQTVLIMQPIDTVGVYMISLATQLGCSVFTSTYDVENLQCLESTFPHIRVIHGSKLEETLMFLTQGQGVDVCIRLTGGDIRTPMELLSKNGEFIQCIPPPHGDTVSVSLLEGKTVSIVRPLDSVSSFMSKTSDDLQALIFNLKEEAISKLTTEGFPESKGVLYKQENCSNFLQPIALDRLLSLVMEPNLGTMMEDLLEADILCVEKIQNLVAPKPKDFSLADTSCLLRNPLPEESMGPLNVGMMQTPMAMREGVDHLDFSPEVKLVHVQDQLSLKKCSPVKSRRPKTKVDSKFVCQTTSTPLNNDQTDGKQIKTGPLEESFLDQSKFGNDTVDKSIEIKEGVDQTELGGGGKIPPVILTIPTITIDKTENDTTDKRTTKPVIRRSIPIPKVTIDIMEDDVNDRRSSKPAIMINPQNIMQQGGLCERPGTPAVVTPMGSFRQMMKDRSRAPPPKLNLLKPRYDIIISSPCTPMTPALKDVLTPKCVSNLVPLNLLKIGKQNPLFIVHPVTGAINLLEPLGKELKLPCFGIQRTHYTPSDSIGSVASFYINAIQMVQPFGPYRISGYSFGTVIALEMARQLQAQDQKVEKLIFLDGSPLYIQSQIGYAMKHLPTHASNKQIDEMLEAGALLNWMSFYGPVENREMKYGLLRKLPTLDDKLNTAVAITFKEVKVSQSPRLTKWFTATEKVIKQSCQKKDQFADAAKEIIRFKRKDKAATFVSHTKMASVYRPSYRFVGDIHLHRIKAEPVFESLELATDYGLQSQCTGKVHLKFYNGNHESFLTKDSLIPLAKDINSVFGLKE